MAGNKRIQEAVLSDVESEDGRANILEVIMDSLRGLRFGQLTILVQDGVAIQIERTEKRRLR